ncbi:proline iminopeptidase-family hydrolase [Fructilactobacillus cliffordii]|uniref:Proline iminopeptidase n=1 Tax=Fructilactobacillus cliffordii TaxID=2940299 RepID=A0A9Q8ZT31_9LACO|nr:proline iminopeptidase-family hydrolase [Fructilactobacillus cliffordii]USS86194.1 proline iminopeptidase-family hydrolase [Fructilactobacillus cliffordii]USS89263.1 proline iminopeptidase-family hydrolase [Fructilactobacillus cliffordii]
MKTGTKIITLENGYHLWTNTQGTGDIHLLALHGGPGGTHEYWEDTAQQLQKQGLNVQVHMYDQLGSWYSDTPDWDDPAVANNIETYEYYVDEVEEVRQKLGLDNFYLIGQSWGGALVQLYAAKYGDHLKGAIISSMVDRISDYTDHLAQIRKEALTPDELAYMQKCEAENNYDNDRYQALVTRLNEQYVDRKQPPAIAHLVDTMSVPLYNAFQGDNEFVITGKLKDWNFTDHLQDIKVPTLVTFGEHETMPLETGKRMAQMIPNARFASTPNGGHHHMIDNAPVYYDHLASFIRDVENNQF